MGGSSKAHFLRTIASILPRQEKLFTSRQRRVLQTCLTLKFIYYIIWQTAATIVTKEILAEEVRVELAANCLARRSAFSFEVEVTSLSEISDWREESQKFLLVLLVKDQKDLLQLGPYS